MYIIKNKIFVGFFITALFSLSLECAQLKEFGYSGFNREGWQETEKVMETLDIKPGQSVADIGAGAGYFTFRFSGAVGPEGRVFAVDVDPDMLGMLEKKTKKQKADNVAVIKGEFGDSMLPDNSSDLVFLCNTYHEMSNHVEYFRKLKGKFRPGGRLAVIDLRPQGILGCGGSHGTKKEIIKKELKKAGYILLKEYGFLSHQNFQIFKPAE